MIPFEPTERLPKAVEAQPAAADDETVIGLENYKAAISLILLRDDGIDQATAAISRARSEEFDWLASATMVFLGGRFECGG